MTNACSEPYDATESPQPCLLVPGEAGEAFWRRLSSPASEPPQLSDTPIELRAVFLSDLHLGLKQNGRRDVLKLLQTYWAPKLFLVGDIIDAWALERAPNKSVAWTPGCDLVLQAIQAWALKGSQITIIPGNHDDYLKTIEPGQNSSWVLAPEIKHISKQGLKCLVAHGDQYDPTSTERSWAARVGARVYERMQRSPKALWADLKDPDQLDPPTRGLAWIAKRGTKTALNWLYRIESRAKKHARAKGADVLIMGHTHHAKRRHRRGLLYFNCGDWVDSSTCVIEKTCGELTLCRWDGEANLLTERNGRASKRKAVR